MDKLDITCVVAVRNEAANIAKCLASLAPAARVIVADSGSTDDTAALASSLGAEVVQFAYNGQYPKKRQWVLDTCGISTGWVLMIDADECVPEALWNEIAAAIRRPDLCAGYLVAKGFHFMGRRLRFGGFSHQALILFRTGSGRFEQTLAESASRLDMEVHERVLVTGDVGVLSTPLIHDDFKGLRAYIDRHNAYSTWEALVRLGYLESGRYGPDAIRARLFGNAQERRRFLKALVIRLPFEPLLWFCFHYFFRLGFLEGRRGFIASRLRMNYIADVHAKIWEARLGRGSRS